MNLEFIKKNEILIVKITERLDTASSDIFIKELVANKQNDINFIMIDFSKLNYISSAGLRSILIIAKELKKQSGELIIYSMPLFIKEVFDMSGFSNIIPIVDDLEQAINKAECHSQSGYFKDTSN